MRQSEFECKKCKKIIRSKKDLHGKKCGCGGKYEQIIDLSRVMD